MTTAETTAKGEDAPVLAVATERGRMYARYPGGEGIVPSITNVISLAEDEMAWWEALCTARDAVTNAQAIADKLSATPDHLYQSVEREITDWLVESSTRDMNISAQRGTIVHAMAEARMLERMGHPFDNDLHHHRRSTLYHVLRNPRVNGVDRTAQRLVEGYIESVDACIAALDPKPVAIEATVWNDEVGYAGTNDFLAVIQNRLVLGDWKTKKKLKKPDSPYYKPTIYPSIALQLAAARHGEEMHLGDGKWGEWQGRNSVEMIGVAIGPNGFQIHTAHPHPQAWAKFKVLRQLWEYTGIAASEFRSETPSNPHNLWA